MKLDTDPIRGLFPDDGGRGPSIQLCDGERFFVMDPRPEDINIRVIAHALPLLCRWTGQCDRFYSVAAHSMFVADVLEVYGNRPTVVLAGLLHDAHETYIGDISRPVKMMLRTMRPGLMEEVDAKLEAAIAERFGLDLTDDERRSVKNADDLALRCEGEQIVAGAKPWLADLPPNTRGWKILEKTPTARDFIKRFNGLRLRSAGESR
jgi:5'-deoxynucleotidase YfbR-like HD superfamily hydrolase